MSLWMRKKYLRSCLDGKRFTSNCCWLGAGLGGFVGFIIVGCIVWYCCCGSWLEKKKGESSISLVRIKGQRNVKNMSSNNNNVSSVVTSMNTITDSPSLQ